MVFPSLCRMGPRCARRCSVIGDSFSRLQPATSRHRQGPLARTIRLLPRSVEWNGFCRAHRGRVQVGDAFSSCAAVFVLHARTDCVYNGRFVFVISGLHVALQALRSRCSRHECARVRHCCLSQRSRARSDSYWYLDEHVVT